MDVFNVFPPVSFEFEKFVSGSCLEWTSELWGLARLGGKLAGYVDKTAKDLAQELGGIPDVLGDLGRERPLAKIEVG